MSIRQLALNLLEIVAFGYKKHAFLFMIFKVGFGSLPDIID